MCVLILWEHSPVRFITGARLKEATVALPFKTCCHREGCDVGSSLPSTASQKLAGSTEIEIGSLDSNSRALTVTPWNQAEAGASALLFVQCRNDEKEALRKQLTQRASVWCRKKHSRLLSASKTRDGTRELYIFSLTLSQLSYFPSSVHQSLTD